MKPYRILRTFPGSQTGNDYHVFQAGTEQPISDDLALIALTEGWIESAEPIAETREAKVDGPEEFKQPKRNKKG